MSDSSQEALEKVWERQAKEEAKAARIAEAVRIGVLTPEIRALPDGGHSLFDEETWGKLQNFSSLRPLNAKSRW